MRYNVRVITLADNIHYQVKEGDTLIINDEDPPRKNPKLIIDFRGRHAISPAHREGIQNINIIINPFKMLPVCVEKAK